MLGKLKIQQLSKLKSRSGLRAIIANTGWLFFDQILRMGLGLVVGVWVARYLGVQQYGLFSYAYAFVTLFGPIANLGLDNLVIRDIVSNPSCKEEILGTTFRLKLLGGVGSLLLAVSCIFWFRQDDPVTLGLVAIFATIGIFQAFDTIDLWFKSQVQSKYTVIAKNTAFFLVTLVKVALILIQAPLLAFAWVKFLELGLGAVGLVIVYKLKGFSIWLWRWSFSAARDLLKESWPMIFSGFAIMIYMRIDQIMLGQMAGDAAVGIYSAATRISEVWYFIPGAISSSVSPSIYAAKQTSESLYYRRIGQLNRLLTMLSLAIALPMTFLSGTIITTLFGNDYAAAGSVLAIHIWASLFVFMGVATSSWFIAEGLSQVGMYKTVIGGISNVLLNLFLIPAYGAIGAAIATVISYAFAGFLMNGIHPKARKIFQIQIRSFLPLRS